MAAENRDHHASLQADDMRQFFLLKSVLNPMGKVVKGLSIDKHHESLLATPTTAGHKEGTMLEYTRRTEPIEKPSLDYSARAMDAARPPPYLDE
jgi:hypothetical protein